MVQGNDKSKIGEGERSSSEIIKAEELYDELRRLGKKLNVLKKTIPKSNTWFT